MAITPVKTVAQMEEDKSSLLLRPKTCFEIERKSKYSRVFPIFLISKILEPKSDKHAFESRPRRLSSIDLHYIINE